ncbi:hypothetical protein [Halomicrobium sp. IBSBa]|uniref:hypothetical protein n=1 Tax=Halomicrobium sp. IBSBa TaxID=2778916 RepID=UPI001ABFBD02|nr:hypothetical protein [Halomicrobium sp. IBSBa]
MKQALRIIGVLFFPITLPIVVGTNTDEYAAPFSSLPGISEDGGIVSGVLMALYISLFIYAILTFSSNMYGGVAEPSRPVDSNTSESSHTQTMVQNINTTQTAGTATTTPEPSQTTVSTEIPEDSSTYDGQVKREIVEYISFMIVYNNTISNKSGVNVRNYTVDPRNESATLYWETNPNNESRYIEETQSVMLDYAGGGERIRKSNNASVSMIPKKLNFVVLTTKGEVYLKSYVSYMSSWRFTKDVTSGQRYYMRFFQNSRPGPAHPSYEANQTTTATTG